MSSLILYQFDECPYCRKVKQTMTALGLDGQIEIRNTRKNPRYQEELRAMNGITQVPCLVVDGKPMLESDDIVAYLNREFRGK